MGTWSIPFEQIAEKAQKDIERVVRLSTLELFKRVIDLSPVAYPPNWKRPIKGYVGGRFRGNWFPSHNLIVRTVSESAKAGDSYQRLEAVMTYPIGGTVFLSNSLPYSARLENGWSNQAPRGMVRLSALQFKRDLRRILRNE